MDPHCPSPRFFTLPLPLPNRALHFGFLLMLAFAALRSDAFDPLDPNGNITIKWDIMSWTADGYVAVVTMYNFQKYRHIQPPGWAMGWQWAQKEIIWSMVGGQATLQGDCSKFHGNIPHCCMRNPTIVDLLPGIPYNQQINNCCRGGVLTSPIQDPESSVAAFQVSVGQAGTSNITVKLPKNFTLMTPGPGYTCGPAKVGKPSQFLSSDGRRTTQALMSWNVTCTYSQFLSQKGASCCVSLSSFYNETIVPCPTCACACEKNGTVGQGGCLKSAPLQSTTPSTGRAPTLVTPLIHCTEDMCPIKIHWHVKQNYQSYWRVKMSVTNRNYAMNYSQWNVVVQHPNLNNVTDVFSFSYEGLTPYGSINDTGMFWGIKYFNDLLYEAGPDGNVQSEILFQKDPETFTFKQGWAYPHKVYFNGDACVLPSPDAYPWLPSGANTLRGTNLLIWVISILLLSVQVL